jgi:redox-sensitive bicupin YhaK (pirin superfamily)
VKENKSRRSFLGKLGVGLSAVIAAPFISFNKAMSNNQNNETTKKLIKTVKPLGFQWETQDPFLFCVHHEDKFPQGNEEMEPVSSLSGRDIGNDFIIKDGFRMYHGKKVPGFPGHPHKGFETITVVREGIVDHADSMGAAGRYGNGDVQWMTAGKGVQHSEMFPLIHKEKENPLELFQIWLNLPAKSKNVDPHFLMMWNDSVPKLNYTDDQENDISVEIIAGTLYDVSAPTPPPNSWASDAENEVAVWNIHLSPNAEWKLPKASEGINRTLYFYIGDEIEVGGTKIKKYHSADVAADEDLWLKNGNHPSKILVLQGSPINEPVIQYGPFVMNTKEEIKQAFDEYHATQFGGWPWPKYDMTHDRNLGRFAQHSDGNVEKR